MQLNIRTEKKYIWLLGYCFIIASIIEVYTFSFLVNAGIVPETIITKNYAIHSGFIISLACFECLFFVRCYNQSTEEQRELVITISAMAVIIIVLFCIINLWRLLTCMY